MCGVQFEKKHSPLLIEQGAASLMSLAAVTTEPLLISCPCRGRTLGHTHLAGKDVLGKR